MKKCVLLATLLFGLFSVQLEAQSVVDKLNPEFKNPMHMSTYELIALPARVKSQAPEHTGTTMQYLDDEGWIDYYRNVFEYENGNLTSWKFQIIEGDDWTNFDLSEFYYENGLITEHIWSEWDRDEMDWSPEFRIVYEYAEVDGQMRHTNVFTYERDNGDWSQDTRITFSWDNGNFAGILDEKWHMNQWIPYMRGTVELIGSGLIYTEQMWYTESGWVNDHQLHFWFLDDTQFFLGILPMLKGEGYRDKDGNVLPSNFSMFQWFDQVLTPENMDYMTFTEYEWDGENWVEEFRLTIDGPVPATHTVVAPNIITMLFEYYDNGNWVTDFIIELYYNEDWSNMLGGADFDPVGEGFEMMEREEYVYEDDLLRYILFSEMMSEELVLYERAILTYDGEAVYLEPETGIPSGIKLAQNYPNPFNPSTQISFEIPEAAEVRLDVFNIQGQQIATLANGKHAAGLHHITFNASTLSSGLYLYRLQVNNNANTVLTRKMMLIK